MVGRVCENTQNDRRNVTKCPNTSSVESWQMTRRSSTTAPLWKSREVFLIPEADAKSAMKASPLMLIAAFQINSGRWVRNGVVVKTAV